MATTLELALTIQAPPAAVFAAATDLDHFGDWMQGFVRVERLSDGPLREGSRFREVRKMFGKEAAEHFEVTRFEPPKRLELFVDGSKGASKRGEYRFVHTFEPLEEGRATRVTLTGTIDGMGPLGAVFGFLFKGMFRRALQRDLEALKAWVERGG